MKIYTKTGDTGYTSLIGGTRILKNSERINAYGTIDELNSFLGLIRDYNIDNETIELIVEIQDKLFTIESLLAFDPKKELKKLPQIFESDVERLELEIDKMNSNLPEIHNFVLPGGHITVSLSHVARTICRRSEREVLKLVMNEPDTIMNDLILKYLNRLSDFLFVLSRKFSKDFNVEEKIWKPKY